MPGVNQNTPPSGLDPNRPLPYLVTHRATSPLFGPQPPSAAGGLSAMGQLSAFAAVFANPTTAAQDAVTPAPQSNTVVAGGSNTVTAS